MGKNWAKMSKKNRHVYVFLKKQTAETRINTGFAGILPVCLCFFLIIMRKKYINIYNRAKKSRQTGRDSFSHVCKDWS